MELLDRLGLRAVRQAREEARHAQADIAASSLSRRERQAAYSGVWKIFVRSRGLASSFQESIRITVGAAAAMNGACAAAATCAMSPSNSTSCGLWSK